MAVSLSAQALSPLPDLQKRAYTFFQDHTSPKTGLVRDRAVNARGKTPDEPKYNMASIAATGMGLAVFAHRGGHEAQILKTLQSVSSLQHYKGWLYHFYHYDTGEPFPRSEVSTIDTALFFAGALYAAEKYPNSEISRLVQYLLERVDFLDMMTDGGGQPNKRTISHGWYADKPKYIPAQWDSYSELMVLYILGLGHPTNPLPVESWDSWSRPGTDQSELSLFTHQFSHLFLDLKGKTDHHGIDYFENSRVASEMDRTLSMTLGSPYWGMTATDEPNGGYFAFAPAFTEGTYSLGCALASILFIPEQVEGDIPYWEAFLGDYGYAESLNENRNWVNKDVLGITIGAAYMAVQNHLDREFWKVLSRHPVIQSGMTRAGLQPAMVISTR